MGAGIDGQAHIGRVSLFADVNSSDEGVDVDLFVLAIGLFLHVHIAAGHDQKCGQDHRNPKQNVGTIFGHVENLLWPPGADVQGPLPAGQCWGYSPEDAREWRFPQTAPSPRQSLKPSRWKTYTYNSRPSERSLQDTDFPSPLPPFLLPHDQATAPEALR